MVLVVIESLGTLDDFVMWASIEFARQYEVFTTRDWNRSPQVIDLSQLSALGGMKDGELLYMVGHGNADGTKMYAGDWETETPVGYYRLGRRIGAHLKARITIHCGACFAGAMGGLTSGLLKIATGLRDAGKTGVKVKGFRGATVTNVVGGPTRVVSDSGLGAAGAMQNLLVAALGPQQKFDSWRQAHPTASVAKTAEASAELNWHFFQEFSYQPGGADRPYLCQYPTHGGQQTGGEEVAVFS